MPEQPKNSSASQTTGEPLEAIQEQLLREGPEKFAKRAETLLSQTQSKDSSLKEKLYGTYGQGLVDRIVARFPGMSLSELQKDLKAFY